MQKAIKTTLFGYRAYAWYDRKGSSFLRVSNIHGDLVHEPRKNLLPPPDNLKNEQSFCLVSSYRPAEFTAFAYVLLYDGDDIRIIAGCRQWHTFKQARRYYENMKEHDQPKAVASLRCIKELETAYRAEIKKRAATFMKDKLREAGLD